METHVCMAHIRTGYCMWQAASCKSPAIFCELCDLLLWRKLFCWYEILQFYENGQMWDQFFCRFYSHCYKSDVNVLKFEKLLPRRSRKLVPHKSIKFLYRICSQILEFGSKSWIVTLWITVWNICMDSSFHLERDSWNSDDTQNLKLYFYIWRLNNCWKSQRSGAILIFVVVGFFVGCRLSCSFQQYTITTVYGEDMHNYLHGRSYLPMTKGLVSWNKWT